VQEEALGLVLGLGEALALALEPVQGETLGLASRLVHGKLGLVLGAAL
jgi:hypothetical protein